MSSISESILSQKDYELIIDGLEKFKKNLESVKDELTEEKDNGSLTIYTFCLNGQSPFYARTNKVCKKLEENITDIDALITRISQDGLNIRAEEISTNVDKLEDEISKKENEIENDNSSLSEEELNNYVKELDENRKDLEELNQMKEAK